MAGEWIGIRAAVADMPPVEHVPRSRRRRGHGLERRPRYAHAKRCVNPRGPRTCRLSGVLTTFAVSHPGGEHEGRRHRVPVAWRGFRRAWEVVRPFSNDEAGQFEWGELRASDALLLGRTTSEGSPPPVRP